MKHCVKLPASIARSNIPIIINTSNALALNVFNHFFPSERTKKSKTGIAVDRFQPLMVGKRCPE